MSAHPYDSDPGLARGRVAKTPKLPIEFAYPLWTNPQVLDYIEEWQQIRDCVAGQRAIKDRTTTYLTPLEKMEGKEYNAYLERAVYFNMTGRTVSALTGIVFNRDPQVSGIPKKLQKSFKYPTKNNISFEAYIKKVCRELITLGRYGVLIDMSPDGGDPYFVGYCAEHILDWQIMTISGREVVTEVCLREISEARPNFGEQRKCYTTIRRLVLEWDEARGRAIYVQYVYKAEGSSIDVTNMVPERIVPTRNGVPLSRIPFTCLGAIDNTLDVDRSPIADIANLNIAHYRSYAQLEQSRFFTAMPIYYVQTSQGNTQAEYEIGSAVVWEVAVGEKPGILEMNGHGLGGLVTACEQKEDQISALGGRLMANQSRSTAESDNALKLKEGNERSILLNIVFAVSEGMTEMAKQWCWWAGADNVDAVEVELNKEFLTDTLGARELRAVYAMYIDGVVPVTVLHFYLQKAEVIPDWMDVDHFKQLLADKTEFANQPDVIAKMKGYNTAKDQQDARLARRDMRNSETITETTADQVKINAELQRKKLEQDMADAEAQREHDAAQAELDRVAAEKEAEANRKAQAANAKVQAAAAAKAAANRPAPAAAPAKKAPLK
jgi:hypothetical protein